MLIGGIHIGAMALLDIQLIWFGYIPGSSPIPVGRSGVILLALMISTAFAATRGGSAPCGWIGINCTILRIRTAAVFTSAALKNNERQLDCGNGNFWHVNEG